MMKYNDHSIIRILASMATAVVLLAVCAYGQDRYVDPETGSNFNDGLTCPTAWATVNFALTGPHAPLPAGTVIHLCGTNGIACSLSSGESFPWTLYNNISIVADSCTNSGGTDHIIDAAGSGQDIIVLDAGRDFIGNRIAGIDAQNLLVIKNGEYGIVSKPAGVTHAPVIEFCGFENMACASIKVVATAGGKVGPIILDNVFKKNGRDNTQIAFTVTGSVMKATIERNTIEKDDNYDGNGIYLNGSPSGNEITRIANNTINYESGNVYEYRYGIYFDAFTGRVECTGNTINYDGSCIYIKSSNPWHPLSRIEGNACYNYYSYYGEGCIVVNNTDDVTIRSCTCDADSRYGSGIKVYDSDRVVLEDNACSKCSDHGICLNNAKDCVLRNNSCDSNEDHGITLDNSDNTTIEGNTCTSNGYTGILIYNWSSGVEVRENESTSNGSSGISISKNSTQVLIERNVCEKNGSDGIYNDSVGTTITANTARKNTSTGIRDLSCDSTLVASNLVVANGGYGIELNASSTPNMPLILHNTVVDNGLNGIWTSLPSTAPAYVANNIFWGSGGKDIAGLAYGQYAYNDIGTGGSPGYGNISKDPLFVSATDYHLSSGSPCIDAGTNLGAKWGTDLDGAPRVLDGLWQGKAVTDMGAFEFHETDLAASGTFQPGSTLDFTVTGPQGASFRIYAAAGSSAPLAAQPGLLHYHYGTFLLDPARLHGSILSGTIPAGGTITVPFNLPGGAWSRYVAFQAAVDDSSGLAGQLTRVVTGHVTQ